MDNVEFLLLLNQEFCTFVCILFLNAFLIYLLRKRIYSILDPLFFQVVTAVCANTVPIFLYIEGYVTGEKVLFILFAEFFFWMGFYIRSRKRIENFFISIVYTSNSVLERKVFLIFFYFLVLSNIYIFLSSGIPLLMDSRFEIFQENTFVVLLNRLSIIPELYCYVYIYNQIRKKRYSHLMLFFILLFIKVLYGGKGFVLNCVYAYFFYSLYYLKQLPKLKLKYLSMIVLSPIIVITVYYGIGNYQEAFMFLLYRFIASGAGYWQGFSYDLIDGIDGPTYAIERVFSFILGPLNIIHSEAKIPLGTLILSQLNPAVIDTIEGANARPPIFAWYCFKWGGVFFTFICGYMMAFFANTSLFKIPRSLIGTSVMAAIYMASMRFSTDPNLALTQLFSLAVFIVLLNIMLKVLSGYNVTFFKLKI